MSAITVRKEGETCRRTYRHGSAVVVSSLMREATRPPSRYWRGLKALLHSASATPSERASRQLNGFRHTRRLIGIRKSVLKGMS